MKVPFYRHGLRGADAEKIARVLDTPFLTSAGVGKHVESMLIDFFEVPHAFLTNSWSNGTVATLLALGIGPGDEVVVPAQTFVATANVVELVGAKPVFADVDPNSLLLTPATVIAAISPATKAIMPVHLYGQMCDMRAISDALADHPDVHIIEDAAHCFEGTRDDYCPGVHSTAAIFSFYATKNVTCGEGGCIITRDDSLAEKIQYTRNHGMSRGALERFSGGRYNHWNMVSLGTKANLPDLLAALLPDQIKMVREQLPGRQALAAYYRDAFTKMPVRLVHQEAGVGSAEHLFPIFVPPAVREEVISRLNERGIEVTINYRSIPSMTFYREKYGYGPDDFPVSYQWGEGTLSLPFYPAMSRDEQDAVIAAVQDQVVPICMKT